MRSTIDCVYCYLKQAVFCLKTAGVKEEEQFDYIYKVMDYIKTFDINATPAEGSTKVLLKVYELLGVDDPYKEAKKESNDLALALYPKLKNIIQSAQDRLYKALKISVAGNIIDLGIEMDFDIEASLEHSLEEGFVIDHYQRFLKKLGQVDEVLLLGDNAGEIVFDKLLAEELRDMGKKVTYVVKGGPVLNDVTMDDALYVGMDKVAKVVTTGARYAGVCLNNVSKEFFELLHNSDLVIAKGQANFESLEHEEIAVDRVYFLFKAKCGVTTKAAGVELGDVVFFTRQLKI
jgi:uncharacterized protein with ATP-grasp and redox domains